MAIKSMGNGLISKLRNTAIAGVVGLSSLVSGCIHTTPQEAARLILKPTLTGNFEDWNKEGEITKIGNQQGQNYQENPGQNQVTNDSEEIVCYVYNYLDDIGSAHGLKENFGKNEPLTFHLGLPNSGRFGDVRLYVINKDTGNKVYEKDVGIRDSSKDYTFLEKTNAETFSNFGNRFECYWKIGDKIVANTNFNIVE